MRTNTNYTYVIYDIYLMQYGMMCYMSLQQAEVFRGFSPSRSLAGRRGLQIQLAKGRQVVKKVAEEELNAHSMSPCSGVTLVSPPRRLSRTKTLPAELRHASPYVPRPRPVSFPNRRNVIFFDWDDTLCPTSWIRSLLKEL